jgi:hypothetical protein
MTCEPVRILIAIYKIEEEEIFFATKYRAMKAILNVDGQWEKVNCHLHFLILHGGGNLCA